MKLNKKYFLKYLVFFSNNKGFLVVSNKINLLKQISLPFVSNKKHKNSIEEHNPSTLLLNETSSLQNTAPLTPTISASQDFIPVLPTEHQKHLINQSIKEDILRKKAEGVEYYHEPLPDLDSLSKLEIINLVTAKHSHNNELLEENERFRNRLFIVESKLHHTEKDKNKLNEELINLKLAKEN